MEKVSANGWMDGWGRGGAGRAARDGERGGGGGGAAAGGPPGSEEEAPILHHVVCVYLLYESMHIMHSISSWG